MPTPQSRIVPTDPEWAQDFAQVAPAARGLGLGRAEYVQAVVEAHGRIVGASRAKLGDSIALPDCS